MRFIGLDVHKDFCEVAVVEGGACWSGPRVRSMPEDLEVFGQSLSRNDHVVLEATGGALAIARILERHAGRGVMANPMAVRAIASAKAKTDRLDARTLARLLAAGSSRRCGREMSGPGSFVVWCPGTPSSSNSAPGPRTRSTPSCRER
ncbi:MAG TPA: transposase [Actinomycetota bacterium]|nr:transposase [Actinomycetota bacterium]